MKTIKANVWSSIFLLLWQKKTKRSMQQLMRDSNHLPFSKSFWSGQNWIKRSNLFPPSVMYAFHYISKLGFSYLVCWHWLFSRLMILESLRGRIWNLNLRVFIFSPINLPMIPTQLQNRIAIFEAWTSGHIFAESASWLTMNIISTIFDNGFSKLYFENGVEIVQEPAGDSWQVLYTRSWVGRGRLFNGWNVGRREGQVYCNVEAEGRS